MRTLFSHPPLTPRQYWFNRLTWGAIAAVVLVDVIWVAALGWDVDWHNIKILLGCLLLPAALIAIFTYWYREPRFALMMHITTQLIIIAFATAAFNYVTSTLGLPLQDARLVAIDRIVGFHWLDYVTWVRSHDQLAQLFTFGYSSAWLQLLVILNLLFLTGRFVHLQHLSFTIFTGAMIAILLAALWPAMGGYVYYGIDPAQLPGSTLPAAGSIHAADLLALRSGQFHRIDLQFKGLVTFPSYHTSFGILLVYASWPPPPLADTVYLAE